jgi:hypothetical protein
VIVSAFALEQQRRSVELVTVDRASPANLM